MNTHNALTANAAAYYTFCREERNFAALLYGALLQPGNLTRFITQCLSVSMDPDAVKQAEIYFEYAFLRDLWHSLSNELPHGKKNEMKREFILDSLKDAPEVVNKVKGLTNHQFNTFFGAVPQASSTEIQMPGKWSLGRFASNIKNPNDLLTVCKFKWAFNIKPDIVIMVGGQVICIEAKMESVEGFYPSKELEKKIFHDHNMQYVSQTEMQRYLFQDILKLTQTQFVFLVRDRIASESHLHLTWAQAFSALDWSGMLPFTKAWTAQLR